MRTTALPLSGYLHPGYARALSEFGKPTELPRSGAWFLRRDIPGEALADGTGCYPFFFCQDWQALARDLERCGNDLVSFAATPDPFGTYTMDDLRHAFPDVAFHFKDHYVADLGRPLDEIVSKHHRRDAERALRQIDVECCSEPLQYVDDFLRLFEMTIRRFGIKGVPAYSPESIAAQLALPGAFMTLARCRGNIVAAHIQMVVGTAAYAHLAAANDAATGLGASYALCYSEIRYFADKVRWFNWGGEAGVAGGTGSLSRFKSGWSTGTRPAYFCGRVFDRERYDRIVRERGLQAERYFPAYRRGEFA